MKALFCASILFLPCAITLRCFQCSDLQNGNINCPTDKSDISQWVNLPGHYSENFDKEGLSCVLGIDSSKNVYFQVRFQILWSFLSN